MEPLWYSSVGRRQANGPGRKFTHDQLFAFACQAIGHAHQGIVAHGVAFRFSPFLRFVGPLIGSGFMVGWAMTDDNKPFILPGETLVTCRGDGRILRIRPPTGTPLEGATISYATLLEIRRARPLRALKDLIGIHS